MSDHLEDRLRRYAELVDRQAPPLEDLVPGDADEGAPDQGLAIDAVIRSKRGHRRRLPALAATAAAVAAVVLLLIPAWLWFGDDEPATPAPVATEGTTPQTSEPVSGTTVPATTGVLNISADTVLTTDYEGQVSIAITADDVTLDCDGHRINGGGLSEVGVLVDGRSNVTITNCIVSGYSTGFLVTDSTGIQLIDNTASENGRIGFGLSETSGSSLVGNAADGSSAGIQLFRSDSNTLRSNVVAGAETGFNLNESDDNELSENRVLAPLFAGFYLVDSSRNRLIDNEVSDAGEVGFTPIDGSASNTFVGNLASGSGLHGIEDGGTGNIFDGNICIDSTFGPSKPPGLCAEG